MPKDKSGIGTAIRSGRVQTFMILASVGLTAFVVWELHTPHPIVNLRLLKESNFLACGVLIYLSFAVLYGANVNTPQMLQELLGYDATRSRAHPLALRLFHHDHDAHRGLPAGKKGGRRAS